MLDQTPLAIRLAEKQRLSDEIQHFMRLSRAKLARGLASGKPETLSIALRGFDHAKKIADQAEKKHGFHLLCHIGLGEISEARRRIEVALQSTPEPVKAAPVPVAKPEPARMPVPAISKPSPKKEAPMPTANQSSPDAMATYKAFQAKNHGWDTVVREIKAGQPEPEIMREAETEFYWGDTIRAVNGRDH